MKALLLTAAALVLFSVGAEAQVLYSTSGSNYLQSFDSLASTPAGATPAWADNSTIVGWYASQTTLRVAPGNSATGGLYSFGSTGSTDRALGSLASGGTLTIFYGVRLTNTTGQTLTSFTLGYTGEQWRDGGLNGPTPSVVNTLTFDYSLTATAISTGTYTAVPGLNFTGPINSLGSATALNGNLAANRVVISNTTVSGLNWLPGTDLWLRWTDINDNGNDHGLGLDDLTFSARPTVAATPEPGTVAFLSACGISGLALLRRRRAARK